MTELQSLALYSGAILAGAVGGGMLPLLGTQRRSDLLLSFSAGVMLGAAFFHMLPEAVEEGGAQVVPAVLGGFLLLYLLERFVLIHVCAEPAVNAQLAQRCVDEAGDHHDHGHGKGTGCEVHTLGLAAWIGMSLHTMVDGFVLGAANADARHRPAGLRRDRRPQDPVGVLALGHPPGGGVRARPGARYERACSR